MSVNKLTIAMNGSMLDEHPTGVGIYSINLINSLSKLYIADKFCELTVFAPVNTTLGKHVQTIKIPGFVKSSRYGKFAAFSRFLWNTFYYPFKTRNFDVLISPTKHGSFLAINQVVTIHDLNSLRYKNISIHQRFYFKYLLPFLISKAKLVITVSKSSRQDIIHYLDYPAEKIKVVHNGYDHKKYFAIKEKQSIIEAKYFVSRYFLAVGATYSHKNLELLIDAYKDLGADIQYKFPLVIAGGKTKYLARLKKRVKLSGLDDSVLFTGYVSPELMPALYREAYALIFPSLYEGFGIPLLEAMACGCPVIASGTSSMPEVCENAALYFDPLNKDVLTSSMKTLISDEVLYENLRMKGLAQSKKFSWSLAAQRLKDLIENINHN